MRRLARLALLLPLITCMPPETLRTAERPGLAQIIAAQIGMLDSSTMVMQFPPPPVYAMWRFEVESCSGVAREGWPTFWLAQRPILNPAGALGLFIRNERRIVLGLGQETVDWIVRHELLHDALNIPKTEDSHPALYFKEKCGALVYSPGSYQ